MSELYLITLLGNLSQLFFVFGLFSGISFIFIEILSLLFNNSEYYDESNLVKIRKAAKWSFIVMAISLMLCTVIPDKKDLYMIYGIGGTIDYIKSNDKAKELPDKTIDALYKWLDAVNEENK